MPSKNKPKSALLVPAALLTACSELILWMTSEWTGYFFTLLMILLTAVILLVSWIVESIERSNIPSWYFPLFWTVLMVSLAVMLFQSLINGFHFDWQGPAH